MVSETEDDGTGSWEDPPITIVQVSLWWQSETEDCECV